MVLVCVSSLAFGQAVSLVYSFGNTSDVGPMGSLIQGRDGAVYGASSGFGTRETDGTVFRMASGGRLSSVHDFAGSDGQNPLGISLGIDGNFYGVAEGGGNSGAGVLFKLTPSGAFDVLYQFTGGSDGSNPQAQPIQASDGNFYGTTDADSSTAGVVYKYVLTSGTVSTIYSFNTDQLQSYIIQAPVVEGNDGNLYGTSTSGGVNGCGTIFELSISGALIQLYSFPCGAGGSIPVAPLIQASDGNLYGTTEGGGIMTSKCPQGCGTIFKLSEGAVTILYEFSSSPHDGQYPIASLVEGTDGNLYGTTDEGGTVGFGTIYQVSTSGQYKQLYSFSSKFGRYPSGGLLQHTNGKFYGTAFQGGTYGEGTLFTLNMGLGPFIALVRNSGRVGQPVQILGQGLTGSLRVTINGVAATNYKVVSDTYMTATIPTGATSGPVVVTTPTGTLTSNQNLRIVQ